MPTLLEPQSTNPQVRLLARLATVEQRLAAIEQAAFAAPVKNGAPAAADGASGSMAVDSSAVRLWVKIGGTWRYAALT